MGFQRKRRKGRERERESVQTGANNTTTLPSEKASKAKVSKAQEEFSVWIHVPFFFLPFVRLQGKVTRQQTTNKSAALNLFQKAQAKERKKGKIFLFCHQLLLTIVCGLIFFL